MSESRVTSEDILIFVKADELFLTKEVDGV